MYDYYGKYTEAHTAGNEKEATAWANQLVWEVARHAVGEEIVVYPLMEKHLGDEGKRLADDDRKDHLVCQSNSVSELKSDAYTLLSLLCSS